MKNIFASAVAAAVLVGAMARAETNAPPVLPLLKVPVRVHLMQSKTEPVLQTTLTNADIPKIFSGVNKIWSQAQVRFDIESIVTTRALDNAPTNKDPKERWIVKTLPKESRTNSAIDVCYIKKITANGFYSGGLIVVKDEPELQPVPGGTDEHLARVTSHELGHALGLAHRQNVTNLMASKTTGFSLNEMEIKRARARAVERIEGKTSGENEAAEAAEH